jgi:hypothetical protein
MKIGMEEGIMNRKSVSALWLNVCSLKGQLILAEYMLRGSDGSC